MARKVLIATGGTGGHLYPAQSLAKKLNVESDIDLLFTGGRLSENSFFEKDHFNYQDISCSSLKLSFQFFKEIKIILKGISQSLKILNEYNPDIIVAFGSFHTLPILVAALLKRKKIYLHEQNKVMGKANRLFARFAKKLMITFPKTSPNFPMKSILVKMPLKFVQEDLLSKIEARKRLDLNPDLQTILVCGGSQGARKINTAFLESLKNLKEHSFQVIHILGQHENLQDIEKIYLEEGIRAYVRSFDPQMHILMSASDFMIGRAGASIISEIIELELPSILIPYPYAGGHQDHNADFMEQVVKGGFKINEKHLQKDFLAKCIVNFFNDENIKEYRHYIKSYKKTAEAKDCAEIILEELTLGKRK